MTGFSIRNKVMMRDISKNIGSNRGLNSSAQKRDSLATIELHFHLRFEVSVGLIEDNFKVGRSSHFC